MARSLFLILVLLNLLVLAWLSISSDLRNNAGREPQRALAQIAPGKIRRLARPGGEGEVCRAYAAATHAVAEQTAKTWSDALPAARISVSQAASAKVFEIVIAGVKTRELAATSLVEMKSLGLTDQGEIRQEADSRYTLVIAAFTERAAAEQAQKELMAKGLRLTSIAERQAASAQAVIEVRGDEAALKTLPQLVADVKALSLTACVAP